MGNTVLVWSLILVVLVADVVFVVWAILSMYYKFLWYHGSKSSVGVS